MFKSVFVVVVVCPLKVKLQPYSIALPFAVLGHALRLGLAGNHVNKDAKFAQEIYKMVELSQKKHVKPWERKHARAVRLYAEG